MTRRFCRGNDPVPCRLSSGVSPRCLVLLVAGILGALLCLQSPWLINRLVPPAGALPCPGATAAGNTTPPGMGTATTGLVQPSGETPGRVVLVFIDRIGLDDLGNASTPAIDSLASGGSIGLMNARVRNDRYGTGSYLLIGSGGRAIAGPDAGLAFNEHESLISTAGDAVTAGRVYLSRTGHNAPPGSIVNLSIEDMIRRTESAHSTSTPGLLGMALREGGKKAALIGNADSLAPGSLANLEGGPGFSPEPLAPEESSSRLPLSGVFHREASCAVMDENGIVPYGDVSSSLTVPSSTGLGVTTDFPALVESAVGLLQTSDLLVIDMGETSRVDEQTGFYSDSALASARKQALEESDAALGEIIRALDPSRDLIIVVSPTPTREMVGNTELLTPLIVHGPGYPGGSSLSSPSTRRKALASNLDIAPTILDFLGVQVPAMMEGRPLGGTGTVSGFDSLKPMRDRIVFAANTRPVMVKIYIFSVVPLLLLAALLSLVRRDLLENYPRTWSWLFLAVLSGPLVYLAGPLIPAGSLALLILLLAGGQLLIALAVLVAFSGLPGRRVDDPALPGAPGTLHLPLHVLPRCIFLVSGLTLALVLVDPLLGSTMSALSPFGTSLVMGARYYGTGNFYMGSALACAMICACLIPAIFTGWATSRRTLIVAAALLGITVAALGFPRLGANVGGLITGIISAPVLLLKLGGRKIRPRHFAVAFILLIAVMGLLVAIDLIGPSTPSHAGRAVQKISELGPGEILAVAGRKLQANQSLLLASNWRFLLLSGIAAAICWRQKLDSFAIIKGRYSAAGAAWAGLATAFVAAALLNDSGVEPAGAIMVFIVAPLFLLSLPGNEAGKRQA